MKNAVRMIKASFAKYGIENAVVIARHQKDNRAWVVLGPPVNVEGEMRKAAVAVTISSSERKEAKNLEALLILRAVTAAASMKRLIGSVPA